jgi:hypothetical protein
MVSEEERQEVVVVDIDMPFWSMVRFMIKWAIASIPAIIVLIVLFSLVMALISGLLGGMGMEHSFMIWQSGRGTHP